MVRNNKKTNNSESESENLLETDFGSRKVSHINQSRMIAIPKMALQNACGTTDGISMNVSMVQQDGEKFLKLSPVCANVNDKTIDQENNIGDDEDE